MNLTGQATLDTATVINMLKDINNITQDISARLNVVENKVLKDINNTTQDISARLNAVETKVSASGVRNSGGVVAGGGGGGVLAAAPSLSAATLEQMRVMLRKQGSGPCTVFRVHALYFGSTQCIFHVHLHTACACEDER